MTHADRKRDKQGRLLVRLRLEPEIERYYLACPERARGAGLNDLLLRGLGATSDEILGFKEVLEAFNVRLSATEIYLEQCATVVNMLVERVNLQEEQFSTTCGDVNALTAELDTVKNSLVSLADSAGLLESLYEQAATPDQLNESTVS